MSERRTASRRAAAVRRGARWHLLVKSWNRYFEQWYCYHSGPSQGLKIRGGLVVLGRDNVPPLVKIGLTDLPKTDCDRPGL